MKCACDANAMEIAAKRSGRPLTDCEMQIATLVKGQLVGRTSGDCRVNTPGVWDDCIPRNVQFTVAGVSPGFAGVTMDPAARDATAVDISFRNGTEGVIALLDAIFDRVVGVDPAVGTPGDVSSDLVLTDIIGAESGNVSFGTFAGEDSEVQQAGSEVGDIGQLAQGIALSALNAERSASFGASANYGGILSKFVLPVVMPQQTLRLRLKTRLGLPAALSNVYMSGQLLMVKFDRAAYDRIKSGKIAG